MNKGGLHIFFLFGMMLIFAACSSKINKQNLGPDEYFEYAKKKFDKGNYFDAVTEFTVITLKYSANPVVDDAQYYLAESHYKQKEYLVAISEYQKLIRDYPQSPYNILSQFKIGMAYFELSLRPELDQEYTKKAIRQFQTFIEENPEHELRENAEKYIQELREKLAEKKFLAATTYRKMGIYDGATIYYDIIIQEYYDTKPAANAYFWKADCLYKLKKFTDAQTAYSIFIEKFPEHKKVAEAKQRLGKLLEELKSQTPESASLKESNGQN